MTEREQRRLVGKQIAPPRARFVIVEERQLADVTRNRDGHLRAGIDEAQQRLRDGRSAFLAGIPAFQDGIRLVHDVGPAWGAAVYGADHQRLAQRGHCIDQSVLFAHDVDIVAVTQVIYGKPFAAGLFGIADRKNDRVRPASHLDRLFDQLQVSFPGEQFDLIHGAVVAGGYEDALRADDIRSGRSGAQAFQDRDGLLGHAGIAAEPNDIRIRANNRDPPHPGRIERENSVVVLEEAHRFLRRLQRQRTPLRIAGNARGQRGIAIRIVEKARSHLEGEDARNRAIDAGLVHGARSDLIDKRCIGIPVRQFAVHTRGQCLPCRIGIVGSNMVQRCQLIDAVVIAGNDSVEAPFAAEHFTQQPGIGVTGNTVDLVIAGHHGAQRCPTYDLAEGLEEVLA